MEPGTAYLADLGPETTPAIPAAANGQLPGKGEVCLGTFAPLPVRGYRALTPAEVDVMNAFKGKEGELGEMLRVLEQRNHDAKLAVNRRREERIRAQKGPSVGSGFDFNDAEHAELDAIARSERACNQARNLLTTGFMWAVRAIANPEGGL